MLKTKSVSLHWITTRCKSSAISELANEIYCYSRDWNFSIQTFYVPSEYNPADEPSRKYSDLDRTLSHEAWLYLERFGPHSFDLMSLIVIVRGIKAGILFLTTRPVLPRDLQGWKFSLIIYQLDTIFMRLRRSYSLALLRCFWSGFPWRVHTRCCRHSTEAVLVSDPPRPRCLPIITFGQEELRLSVAFPLPSFSRVAITYSAMGSLGVPMCLLVETFFLWYLLYLGFKALESCPTMLCMSASKWLRCYIWCYFCQACGSRTYLNRIAVPRKTADHTEIFKRFR